MTIGTYAFGFCSNLASITLPSRLRLIGFCAFDGCERLNEITIPAATTRIAPSAFDRCRSLRTFIVDKDNPSYCSIDGVLYDKTGTTLEIYPAGRKGAFFILPGVINIGHSAFFGRDYLTGVIIPDTVVSIGRSALSECSELSSVSFSNGLRAIGYSAFASCEKLSSVELPEGLQTIQDRVFAECENLASVSIPASVTNMGNSVCAKARKRTTHITIIGHKGSIAEEYAHAHNYVFLTLMIINVLLH